MKIEWGNKIVDGWVVYINGGKYVYIEVNHPYPWFLPYLLVIKCFHYHGERTSDREYCLNTASELITEEFLRMWGIL
jgi:hypothetical protein